MRWMKAQLAKKPIEPRKYVNKTPEKSKKGKEKRKPEGPEGGGWDIPVRINTMKEINAE